MNNHSKQLSAARQPFCKDVVSRNTAIALWTLLALFILRVAGQVIVFLYSPSFLPAMDQWYSGLMPYVYLLPTQIVIVVVLAKIAYDISVGTGSWSIPKRRLGCGLIIFGVIYFVAMIVRYVLWMSWHPEQRWFGGTIPIIFHWVLASYIMVLGTYNCRQRS